MVIRCLVEYMNEELDDAKKYVEAAGGSKDKTLAATYLTLAGEEIGHFTKLHDQASRLIEEARSKGTTLPAGMMELYNYEHKKLIERMAAIKVMMDTVK